MPLPSLPWTRFISSRQLIPGSRINEIQDALSSFLSIPAALAGGGRTGSPVLNAAYNEILVTASGADSVQLPKAVVGLTVGVLNSGAQSLQVFANGTDVIINGVTSTAGSVGITQATLVATEFTCNKTGRWTRYVST